MRTLLTKATFGAGEPSKAIEQSWVKPEPAMLTGVPPVVAPDFGVTSRMVGVGGASTTLPMRLNVVPPYCGGSVAPTVIGPVLSAFIVNVPPFAPTSTVAGMSTVVDTCNNVSVIGSRYGVALTTTLMLCPTNRCGAAGLKERSMDWNVRTPADSLVPPRTGGRVTSTRALHGAVRASTVKLT